MGLHYVYNAADRAANRESQLTRRR